MKLTNLERAVNKLVDPYNWMDINEAEEYCRLSKSTIYRAIKIGKLKCSKTNNKLLFKRVDIDRWLYG